MPSDLVADLSHNALLSISGDDAAAFLHAQFTNDVEALAPGEAQWNGWCSAKGRLLATFLLVRRPEGFLLMLPAEIAAPIAKRLAMFVLRSKAKIADVSELYTRIGIAGPNAASFVEKHWGALPPSMAAVEKAGALAIALDAERFVALVPAAAAPAFWDLFSADWQRDGADAWELRSVRSGMPTIVAATQEAFVPQMANFELVGGVSFKKGCYPGQEIVARTQYRGILKKRMALAHVDGTERPLPGQSVYSSAFGEQSAGTIVNAAPAPGGGFDALVVAQVESLALQDLRWKSPDGPAVRILEHPPLAKAS
jgi:folate-binding protein YgfZ